MRDETLLEAKRLYKLGFAILWLHPRSKRPIGEGWTRGPRKEWDELVSTYRKGFNVGVRTGTPSRVTGGYLAVIDVDVKSDAATHRREAMAALRTIIDPGSTPCVRSGFGKGSGHYYVYTLRPFNGKTLFRSSQRIKAHLPSRPPSKRDLGELSKEEIKAGMRTAVAWEIALYSEGRQMVLPPSVHPDTGKNYFWKREIGETLPMPLFKEVSNAVTALSKDITLNSKLEDFLVTPVELEWVDISDGMRNKILKGEGVTDRSAFLLTASEALFSAGLSQNEVLTVLTDPKTFLGEVGYDHAQTKSRARAAAWVHRYTVRKVKAEKNPSTTFSNPPREAKTLSAEEKEKQDKEIESARNWKEELIRSKQGGLAHLVQNVVLILRNAVPPGVVKRDEVAYRDVHGTDAPWGAKQGDPLSDDHIAQIKFWLGTEFGFEPSSSLISDALVVISTENSFDPLKDFLDTLPKWDGKKRLDTWLRKYFNGKGNSEYLAQVFRKWMVAMVMRAYNPGAKFDWMPIFEGDQDLGKSSFGRLLVTDKYFCDWLPNFNDKDSALALQGMWGVEFGELSQFKKQEIESIKSFIVRTVDKIRPPYGRRIIESARRCVFFGTTNRDRYLTDDTGNRRFKPVVVGQLDFQQLEKDRLQLFAEAKYLWDEKIETPRTLEMKGEAKVAERKIQEEKMVLDDSQVMRDQMLEFLEKVDAKEVVFDLTKFRILDLFSGGGPLAGWRSDNRNFQFAGKMLKNLGAESRMIHGLKTWKIEGSPKKPETLTPTNGNEEDF